MRASTPVWFSDSETRRRRRRLISAVVTIPVPRSIAGPRVIPMPALPSIPVDENQLPLSLLRIPDARCAVHALVVPRVLVGG
jgi:hypothetical protein